MAIFYITKKQCYEYGGKWVKGRTYPSGETKHGYCDVSEEQKEMILHDGIERSPHYHRYLNDNARKERERKSRESYEREIGEKRRR